MRSSLAIATFAVTHDATQDAGLLITLEVHTPDHFGAR